MCSSGVLPIEADAAVCWERTYTTDKSIPLANLIMPQVLPLQRVSPSCRGSDIHCWLQRPGLSMQQRQCSTEIRAGPQGEHPTVARLMATALPFSKGLAAGSPPAVVTLLLTPICARATSRSQAAQAATQHRFQPPFPGHGTASVEQHGALLQRNSDMTATDRDV